MSDQNCDDCLWEYCDVTVIEYKVSDSLNTWIPIKWISHDNLNFERILEIKQQLVEEHEKDLQLALKEKTHWQSLSWYKRFKIMLYNHVLYPIVDKWNNLNCFRQ